MIINFEAFAWGIKGARAGLRLDDNPYSSPSARSAWIMGYREEKVRRLVLASSPAPCGHLKNDDAGSRNRHTA